MMNYFKCLGFLTAIVSTCFGLFSVVHAQGIGGFDLKSCDSNNSEIITATLTGVIISPGTDHELCYELRSVSDEPQELVVQFVDATWNEDLQKALCESGERTQLFGDFVTYKESITLDPKKTQRFYPTVNFGIESAGEQHGCVVVVTKSNLDSATASGIGILYRKGSSYSVYVDEDVEVGLELMSPDKVDQSINLAKEPFFLTQRLTGYNAQLGFKNTGGLTQEVIVNGSVSGPFGFEMLLEEQVINISAGSTNTVEYSFEGLPWYKMGYSVNLDIVHHATSDIRSKFITEELLKDHNLSASGSFFLFPRRLVLVALALLLFIWFLFWITKKRKKSNAHQAELEAQLAEFKAMKAQQQEEQSEQQQQQ